jgi:hypothetical protein
MSEVKPPFRTGDSVVHGPTGETWVIAYADPATGYMSWLGWPSDGEAKITDCTLDEAASDADHQRWLRDLVKSGGSRAARAVRLYGEPEPAPEPAGRLALAAQEGGEP